MTTEPIERCPFHASAADTAGAVRADTTPGGPRDASTRPPFATPPSATSPSATSPSAGWPPGPPSAITGWTHLAEMARDLPATVERWQRTYGDLVHLRIWPEHQVVVNDPTLARELLVGHADALVRQARSVAVFASIEGRSVLTLEGPAWKSRRAALQPTFAPRAVQAFVPTLAQAAERALSHWPAQAADWPIESALTSVAMDVIMRMTFSTDIGDDARSAEEAVHTLLAQANAELYWPASWPDWMPWKRAKRRALATLDALIDRHLRTRLTHPQDAWPEDLLTRLLRLHRDDPATWTRRAVRDECVTAFIAGHETVAATLTWWAWCMAANLDAQARAADEVVRVLGDRAPRTDDLRALPWLTQTLQETLRLYPAAPVLMNRRATRPIELGGWRFPARTLFMVPLMRMHHDPRWFPEPMAFRPERFAPDAPPPPRGAWMPFGAGPRVCLGQHLAMTELTVVAAMVLRRFELSVPAGRTVPRPVLNVSLRPEAGLSIAIGPRSRVGAAGLASHG